MYHSDKRCYITVTSNLQLSGTAKVCFLLILCSSPVGKKPAHHTPLGIQSNRKSPCWKLLIRAPEGKVSCEGSAASIISAQNWQNISSSSSSLASTIHMPLTRCTDAESVTPHILEARKTRTARSSTLMITLYTRLKNPDSHGSKVPCLSWEKATWDTWKSAGLGAQRQRPNSWGWYLFTLWSSICNSSLGL